VATTYRKKREEMKADFGCGPDCKDGYLRLYRLGGTI
jgi:hypothetical protein